MKDLKNIFFEEHIKYFFAILMDGQHPRMLETNFPHSVSRISRKFQFFAIFPVVAFWLDMFGQIIISPRTALSTSPQALLALVSCTSHCLRAFFFAFGLSRGLLIPPPQALHGTLQPRAGQIRKSRLK